MGEQAEVRLGFILPSGGTEHEYYRAAELLDRPARVFIPLSRDGTTVDEVSGVGHSVEALTETADVDHLVDAPERVAGQIGGLPCRRG